MANDLSIKFHKYDKILDILYFNKASNDNIFPPPLRMGIKGVGSFSLHCETYEVSRGNLKGIANDFRNTQLAI